MADMTPNDVLDAAADVILQRGWSPKGLVGPNGEVCTVRALRVAAGAESGEALEGAARAAYKALCRAVGGRSLGNWNDYQADSVDDVLRLLKDTRVPDERAHQ